MSILQKKLSENPKLRIKFAEERFLLDVSDAIQDRLEAMQMDRAELAGLLKTDKSHVTQILSGYRNMTLRTLARICLALKIRPKLIFVPLGFGEALEVQFTDADVVQRESVPFPNYQISWETITPFNSASPTKSFEIESRVH